MADKPNIWTSHKFYITKSSEFGNNTWRLHMDGIIHRKCQLYPVITVMGILSLGIMKLIHRMDKNMRISSEAYKRGVSDTKIRITNDGVISYKDMLNISDVLAEKKRNKMKTKYSALDEFF